jgi:UDP-N-acetylmuramoyl-tripeptide--D-alanyl-D-alanine ligase
MKLTVNQVMKAAPGAVYMPVGSPSTEVDGAFVDSRDVVEGAMFVGLRGETQDGGHYAPDALRRGAAAAVIGESTWRWLEGDLRAIGKPVLVAASPLEVLQAGGRLALERVGAQVVAITGATGKTTTKDILVAMLRSAGVRVEGTPGNRNTEVGVPMSLMALAEDTQIAVVEMGMRGLGQIAELARLAPPDVGCITSIGPVHLELLGTVENVAAAKFELITSLKPGSTAVVPADEPFLRAHLKSLNSHVRVVEFGAQPTINLKMNLATTWQLRCAAAALECCRALDRMPQEGATIDVTLSAMRGSIRRLAVGGTLIEDCYNANPIAMQAALVDLSGREGRRVAVLGDMMELGPDEAVYHREIGVAAVAAGVELVIGVGTRATAYLEGAAGVETAYFATVDDAVAGVGEHLRTGDVVLLKGSRSMALERVAAVIAADS